ncbi:hypothetical protein HMPREF2757_07590 [Brevibacterium sp. HMSC063G07]|nr:hypothetical protein HMPREF2757_07590 [Brevibacterium sp. HMSC063G07]
MAVVETALIIPAAGSGTRLGADRPKAFVELEGRTLLAWSLRCGLRAGCGLTVIAAPAHLLDHARTVAHAECDALGLPRSLVAVVEGGTERTDSVAAALTVLESAGPRFVLVHDAARALTPEAVFTRVIKALRAGERNVVPTLPVADTIRTVSGDTSAVEDLAVPVDRSQLRRVQTPQGFRTEDLRAAHQHAREAGISATDDAGLLEAIGIPARGVPGAEAAHKITYPDDLRQARARLRGE